MMTEPTYKVLWVDDNKSIVDSTRQVAEDYNIELEHFTNWKEAEQELDKHFNEYSAIILDANCKMDAESIEEEGFLVGALPALTGLFGRKQESKPWYVLSAGTMQSFNLIIQGANKARKGYEEEWGPMLFLKDAVDDSPTSSCKLFENIQRVAKDYSVNVILYRHSDVFAFMGEGKLFHRRARELMLRMLSPLYYPEENPKYEYPGNPLRKILEYLFRAANKMGLLADDCIDKEDDRILLQDASLYMAGLNTKYSNGARWGEAGKKNGKGGDAIFPPEVATVVKCILKYANVDSHTKSDEKEDPYFVDDKNKELFSGYVLQLCHVIKWFGHYVSEHPDVAANKSNQRRIEVSTAGQSAKAKELEAKKAEYEGKEVEPSLDDEGNIYYEDCLLPLKFRPQSGKIRLKKVVPNTKGSKDKYPLFASYEILKNMNN